jgi:hypothetical protein
MSDRPGQDLLSQAELRKGAEFMVGTSSAVRLVQQLYLDALERRMAMGAAAVVAVAHSFASELVAE